MKKITYICIYTLCVILSSCESWLLTSPKDSISADDATSNIENLSSVLISCYEALQDDEYYGRDFIVKSEVLSDNCRITIANTNRFVNEYVNAEGAHMDCWAICYTLIGRTNHVITNIDKVEGNIFEKNRIKGQALFLRALAYHDLLRSYAREPGKYVDDFDLGVPVVKKPFVGKIDKTVFPQRDKVDDNYLFVENDLLEAFRLLENNDGELAPYLVSAVAVKSLLSRVYLYQEKWESAYKAASYVIEKSGIELEKDDYIKVFSLQSESVFALAYTISEGLIFDSLQSIYSRVDDGKRDEDGFGNDLGAGYGDVVPSDSLLNSYAIKQNILNKSIKESEKRKRANLLEPKIQWT